MWLQGFYLYTLQTNKGGRAMKTFKYQVTWLSFFQRPEIFVTNSEDDVKTLKEEGRNQQFKVEIEEGEFTL
jgi:hypothetical protein